MADMFKDPLFWAKEELDKLRSERAKLFELLRVVYNIPDGYGPILLSDGSVSFSYCDESITINTDGSATRSWMGLNTDATSHEFYKESWKGRKP